MHDNRKIFNENVGKDTSSTKLQIKVSVQNWKFNSKSQFCFNLAFLFCALGHFLLWFIRRIIAFRWHIGKIHIFMLVYDMQIQTKFSSPMVWSRESVFIPVVVVLFVIIVFELMIFITFLIVIVV